MPGYVLNWNAGKRSETWSQRPYADDRAAIRSALRFYQSRHQSQTDELWIYEGRRDGWGFPDGRLLGKVAFNSLGTSFGFVPVNT